MQRKDLFVIIWETVPHLHTIIVKASLRVQVNHATHERLGLTEHILSVPFLLEYSLFRKNIYTKKREKFEICGTLIKK